MRRTLCLTLVCYSLMQLSSMPVWPAAGPGWQEEWDRVQQSAKKEGRVAMIGPVGSDRRDALTLPFQQKYGIAVEYLPDTARGIPPRIATEREAGRYLWDIIIAGALEIILLPMNVLEAVEPALILPEVRDAKLWRGGALEFLDPGRTILVMTPFHRGTLFVNPTLVDPKNFKSYKELLDPKWKGKIVIDDPRRPGPGQATFTFFYLHPNLGPTFIRELGRQQLLVLRDYSQEADAVGQGKYPAGIGFSDSIVEERAKQGVPIAIVDPRQLREGSDVSPASGQVGLFTKAAHPNAAKLYLNWLLSKEGQTAFARATGYVSNRLDVPTDQAAPWRVPQPGAIKTYGLEARKVVSSELIPLLQEVLGR